MQSRVHFLSVGKCKAGVKRRFLAASSPVPPRETLELSDPFARVRYRV